jgi:transposase
MNEYEIICDLVGLPQIRVTQYRMVGTTRIGISVESTLAVAVCPTCGKLSEEVLRQDEAQSIRDLRMWNRECILRYPPQRYRCQGCQDSFTEQVAWRNAGRSYTQRYEQWIAGRVRREPISHIAQSEGISEETVQGIFERMAKKN